MNNIVRAFEQAGFTETKHGVYLKNVIGGKLSHWAAASTESDNALITLGAIAPKVNRFALGLLKRCSQGRIKPQFPAYVVPPIFITHSVTAPTSDAENKIHQMIDDFENRFGNYTVDDWFKLAAELMPYAPSQAIILPAYYYLERDREALIEYLSKKHLANPATDVTAYLEKLREMATELEADTVTRERD